MRVYAVLPTALFVTRLAVSASSGCLPQRCEMSRLRHPWNYPSWLQIEHPRPELQCLGTGSLGGTWCEPGYGRYRHNSGEYSPYEVVYSLLVCSPRNQGTRVAASYPKHMFEPGNKAMM